MKTRKQAERIALCGMLLALMLVLGFVESQIPVAAGIPGVKLGLSNGVLIFAVYMLGVPTSFLLMGLKVLLSGMLFGSPSAMMYAFAGGVVSLTVMCLLSRMQGLSPVVVSMIGGLSHNVGQVALAMIILS
ncbi:MAG: Gx transporter family protein, partial [Clostridia bacterium]|nr:Gx transporter family protein [Clostridia bacterium]